MVTLYPTQLSRYELKRLKHIKNIGIEEFDILNTLNILMCFNRVSFSVIKLYPMYLRKSKVILTFAISLFFRNIKFTDSSVKTIRLFHALNPIIQIKYKLISEIRFRLINEVNSNLYFRNTSLIQSIRNSVLLCLNRIFDNQLFFGRDSIDRSK